MRSSRQLSAVAAALAVYRADHGAYPVSLNELSQRLRDDMPVDLFTGKPFLYEEHGKGFVLYSVGENLTDDNASGAQFYVTRDGEITSLEEFEQDNDTPEPDDIVLRVPNVRLQEH